MLFKIGIGSIAQVKTLAEVRCQSAGPFIVAAVAAFPAKEKVVAAFLRIPEQGAGSLVEGCQYRTEPADVIEIIKKVAAEISLCRSGSGPFGCPRAMAGLERRLGLREI